MPAEAFIESVIKNHPVVVFSKTSCPFCTRTKTLLTSLNVKFELIELDTRDDGTEIQEALHKKTGQNTVPNIFIGGEHIGGNSDLTALNKNGKLVPLLKQCKALN